MKFVWIFCNQSIAPEVIELLDSLEVDGYTVWRHVLGHLAAGTGLMLYGRRKLGYIGRRRSWQGVVCNRGTQEDEASS